MGIYLSYLGSYLMCFLLLTLLSLPAGAQDNQNNCNVYIMTFMRNINGTFHDYFGKPLNMDQIFDDERNCKIFHFQITSHTKHSNLQPTDNGRACCQWNSEGCYIYVWFKTYYYLLISPIVFERFEDHHSKYLDGISICASVPSIYFQESNIFHSKVSVNVTYVLSYLIVQSFFSIY